jgi:hypothetical protein
MTGVMMAGAGVTGLGARAGRWEVEFDQAGALRRDGGLTAAVGPGGPADLMLFCPGWNASPDSARELSDAMIGLITEALPAHRRAVTGFVTVYWPALLFPEDEPAADGPVWTGAPSQLSAPEPTTGAELAAALAPAFPERGDELARIGLLLDTRPRDTRRLTELHRLASELVTTANPAVEDDGECTARTARTGSVLEALAELAPDTGDPRDTFDALWDGGRELIRVLSYYEMKNRAGAIGRVGLGPLLDRLRAGAPGLRVHLVGHSFGARLVAFALAGLPAPSAAVSPVKSLVLIQGAFSHSAFTPALPFAPSRSGALACFTDRLDGPALATFSASDRALGRWYPSVSRLTQENVRAGGAAPDRWGALGHHGFRRDGALTRRLDATGTRYGWRPGRFYRMDANRVINRDLSWLAGAHCDIRKPELAWAAVSAAGLGE